MEHSWGVQHSVLPPYSCAHEKSPPSNLNTWNSRLDPTAVPHRRRGRLPASRPSPGTLLSEDAGHHPCTADAHPALLCSALPKMAAHGNGPLAGGGQRACAALLAALPLRVPFRAAPWGSGILPAFNFLPVITVPSAVRAGRARSDWPRGAAVVGGGCGGAKVAILSLVRPHLSCCACCV